MASVIQKNIFGLEVSVNDIEAMETLESTEKLGRVEASTVDIEALILLKVIEKLSAVDKGKHKVKLLRRLKREFERHNEGVVDLRQD